MPAYPAYVQDAESQRKPAAGTAPIVERTGNNTLRARILGPGKSEFAVVHALTRAQTAALQAWRSANLGVEVDFHWEEDGSNYTVVMLAPLETRRIGWDLVIVTATLLEV